MNERLAVASESVGAASGQGAAGLPVQGEGQGHGPAARRATRWPVEAPAKYQLLRVLGSGGMGTVLLARDRSLGRLVALKFLRESCTTFLERFRREARLMAALPHPAIVKVHEFERCAGRSYLSMEYVDGGNLALARLAPRELVRRLASVVDALGFAHERGIVHRDVKPENVLLDRRGRALLTDFGLALDGEEGVGRRAGRPLVGTPLTMSPEQARGETATHASDVFSLGVTLYRKLCDEWPFRGRTVADVLGAIERDAPPPPRALRPAIPRALETVVLKCLEKDPGARFGSMRELRAALDRSISGGFLVAVARTLFAGRAREERPGPRIHPEAQW